MILVAVLWIVAALSIIVSGLVHATRNEVRLSAASRQTAIANALGNAAIHMVLQEMAAKPEKIDRLTYKDVTFRNVPIRVQVLPLNGLIDINKASIELLTGLLTNGGKLDAQTAAQAAKGIVDGRLPSSASPNNRGYEATEDLLRIPGISYDVYANIAPLITVDAQGSGRINPLAAPPGVLSVMAEGNVERAGKIASDRDAGLTGIDTTTTLNGAFVENGANAKRFRIQARTPLPDGSWLLSSRSVDFGTGMRDGLPWSTFYTESRLDKPSGKGY